ncbi:MAG: L-threonylcarbamoyladenylate synthase [Candidatus Omnitrophota bacterium]|jgi:L-threonylcarbamoyladenylate synthase
MNHSVVIKLDVRDPDLSKIREFVRAAREGKLVVFPTETVYGIGGPMSVPGISDRLVRLKERTTDKPFSYHIGEKSMLEFLHVSRTASFRYMTRLFWPGPVTFLVLNQAGEKIGIRYPRHRVTTALINASGEPFIATSANRSGQPSPRTAEEAMEQLGDAVDYLIDCGKTECAQDSSIVDLTAKTPQWVRRAAMAAEVDEAIRKVEAGKFPRKKILVVCTGTPAGRRWRPCGLSTRSSKREWPRSSR